MRLLSFAVGGRESWGAVVGDDVADIGRTLPNYLTLADFVGSAEFERREALVASAIGSQKLPDVDVLPVIPRPEKIVCAVRNYLDHHNEAVASGLRREITEFPPIFLRAWRSLVGHNAPVIRPKVSDQLDWEGELAVVIGTPDEIGDPTALKLETRVNGEIVQQSDTSQLIFSIPRFVHYCSTIFDLMPGDVIATGTPAGVGFARKPPVFLKPGDVVEVEIEKIGVLRNPVVAE
ncbi:fumarylacetoacetate hydrolase family protein [Bradyrhizobium liaoningense]|nr:fumarylacetoacetate hydrolase family protein [Bradyrhizobium liaoningense]